MAVCCADGASGMLGQAPSCGGSRASRFSSDPARDGLRATAGVFVNDTHELIETKNLLLELGSKGSRSCSDPTESNGQCLLERDVGRTNMLSKEVCYDYVGGPGPGPGARGLVNGDVVGGVWQDGYFVPRTLCKVSTSSCTNTRSGESTPGRQRRAEALHRVLGRPAQRPTGWCDRCVGTQLPNRTPRLHLRLRSTSTTSQNQKPGQIDFGRLLVVGNAVTILKSVRRRQTIAHRRRRSLPVHQIYMCSNTTLSAVYRTSTQAEAYGIRRRRPRELARELDKASRVVFITEPEGRAWRATDRLLADRCRGAPRNPKAPVMLAKPQIRTQIMTAPGRPGRPSRQLSSQPRLDTVRHLAPRPRRAWQPGSHLSVPLSPVLAPASASAALTAPAYYLQAAHACDSASRLFSSKQPAPSPPSHRQNSIHNRLTGGLD